MTSTTDIKKASPGPLRLISESAIFSARLYLWTAKRMLKTAVGIQ